MGGYLKGARAFCNDYLSEVMALECKVFSDKYRYAGSADLWGRSNRGSREVMPADWKIGKKVHLDHALRLAAYAGADWMADSSGVVRKVGAPATAAVVRLDEDGGYEARFLGRERLQEYFSRFIRFAEMKGFLDLGDGARDAARKGNTAAE